MPATSDEPAATNVVMPWGKHRGTALHKLPCDYFDWLHTKALQNLLTPASLNAEVVSVKKAFISQWDRTEEDECWPEEY